MTDLTMMDHRNYGNTGYEIGGPDTDKPKRMVEIYGPDIDGPSSRVDGAQQVHLAKQYIWDESELYLLLLPCYTFINRISPFIVQTQYDIVYIVFQKLNPSLFFAITLFIMNRF